MSVITLNTFQDIQVRNEPYYNQTEGLYARSVEAESQKAKKVYAIVHAIENKYHSNTKITLSRP